MLDRLSVEDLLVTPTELQLYDLVLTTPSSELSDSLRFTFPGGWGDWVDFNDRVRMDIGLNPSTLAVRDLLYFRPQAALQPLLHGQPGAEHSARGRLQRAGQ